MRFVDPRTIPFPRLPLLWKASAAAVVLPVLAWEIGVYQRKIFIENTHKECLANSASSDANSFYGRRWGYRKDAELEQSLRSGDLVFVEFDIRGLHFWQAIRKYFISRQSQWDRVGIVRRSDYLTAVLIDGLGYRYQDLLRDFRVGRVGIKRLKCSREGGEQLNWSEKPNSPGLLAVDKMLLNGSAEESDIIFIASTYRDAGLVGQNTVRTYADLGRVAQMGNKASFSPIFLAKNGAGEFMNMKTSGHLGGTSYQKIVQR